MKEVKTTVYKCNGCSKIGTKKQIETCEAKHAKKDAALIKQETKDAETKRVHDEEQRILNLVRLEASAPEEVARLIEKYAKQYFNWEVKITCWPKTYNNHISNSHTNPVNGITNWHHDKKLPTGYAGFDGSWKELS